MTQPLDRPEDLPGQTYKIKWLDSDHAFYITINDIEKDGRRRPFEVFINSKNMEHYAWTLALTRMISAVFRRGGDVSFVVDELKAVFDPRGGQWMDGRYVPSLLAAIGERDRAPPDRHRLPGARGRPSDRRGGSEAAGTRGGSTRADHRRRRCPDQAWPVPQLRRGGAFPSGRLRHLPQLRLFTLRLIPAYLAGAKAGEAGGVMIRRILLMTMAAVAAFAGGAGAQTIAQQPRRSAVLLRAAGQEGVAGRGQHLHRHGGSRAATPPAVSVSRHAAGRRQPRAEFAGFGRAGEARRADRHQRTRRARRRRDQGRALRPPRVRREARHPGRPLRSGDPENRRRRREVSFPRIARLRFGRGRRHRAGDRQSVRPVADGDQRDRLGRRALGRRRQRFRASSCRPTRPSIPAIRAARWSAWTGG